MYEEKWRALFDLGDRLLSLKYIHEQIDTICEVFSKITGGKVEMQLSQEFKPLPHHLENSDINQATNYEFTQREDDQIYKQKISEGLHQNISIPLRKDARIIGTLLISFNENIFISKSELEFFLYASKYLTHILELSRLTKIKDWRLEQLSLIRSVSNEIVQLRDPKILFLRIVELIQSAFNFYFVVLHIFDEVSNKVIYRSSAGTELSDAQMNELIQQNGIELGKGLVGICAQEGNLILSNEVKTDKRYRLVNGLKDAESEICLPLEVGKKVLGVLEILSNQPERFHDNDILVLRILSDNVALAIENAKLFDDLLEQTWVSTLMLQVSEAAQRLENVEDLLDEVTRMTPLLTGVQKCTIYLIDQSMGEFILYSHYGFEAEEISFLAMLPFSNNCIELFNRTLSLRICQPLDRHLFEMKNQKSKLSSCCGVIPVCAHGENFGTMLVDDIGKPQKEGLVQITRSEAFLSVAHQTALAIENLRLQESQENEAYVNTILLQVAELVTTSSDLNETIESIINLLPLVLGVDAAFVYLLDQQRTHFFECKIKLSKKNPIGQTPNFYPNIFEKSFKENPTI